MARSIHSQAKRQREQRKQSKRREKEERRRSRTAEKQAGPSGFETGSSESDGPPEVGADPARPA